MIYAEISSKKRLQAEDSPPIAKLPFPASETEINKAFEAAGITGTADCQIEYVPTDLDFLNKALSDMAYGENAVSELNCFASQLAGMDDFDREILNGMTVINKPDNMKDLINLAANLDGIHFVPEVKNAKQLGKFLVENGFVDIDPDVWKYLDYAKIGQERLQSENCCITINGYFEDGRRPEEITEIYDGVTLPEHETLKSPELDNDMQMGGMDGM